MLAQRARDSPTVPPRAHGAELERVTAAVRTGRREPLRLAFSVPPQHYKTTTVSHWLAQLLSGNPGLRFVYTPYNQAIVERKATRVQNYTARLGV